jgi:hypothetical protein
MQDSDPNGFSAELSTAWQFCHDVIMKLERLLKNIHALILKFSLVSVGRVLAVEDSVTACGG